MNKTKLRLVPQKPDLDLSHLMDHDQDWIYGRNWINLDNPDLTLEERIRRRMELHEISVNLGYHQPKIKEELYTLKKNKRLNLFESTLKNGKIEVEKAYKIKKVCKSHNIKIDNSLNLLKAFKQDAIKNRYKKPKRI